MNKCAQNLLGDDLKASLLKSLIAGSDQPVFSVLDRAGNATDITGRQLIDQAKAYARMLETCLGPGAHTVVVALPPGADFLAMLVSMLLSDGAIVAVALPRKTDPAGRLARVASRCGASAILCLARNREMIEAQLWDAESPSSCAILAIDEPEPIPGDTRCGRRPVAPIIQLTSGSTQFPKAVPVSAAQVMANCRLIQTLWSMSSQTVLVNWLPHYHDMGLMGCILYPLLSGARSIQMSPFDMIRRPASWLEAISRHKATISGGPPFAYLDCLNRISEADASTLDLSSWSHAFCGAEPIPAGLLDRFRDRFMASGLAREAVFGCYGMAECTLFAAGERGPDNVATQQPEPKQMVEGCLLSETTQSLIRIFDTKTRLPVLDGEVGEICLTGPSVCDGYISYGADAEENLFIENDGAQWLRTGDLGKIFAQRLYITGRIKDVFIVNGRNVASAEVEWLSAREHADLNPAGAAAILPKSTLPGHAALLIELRAGLRNSENLDPDGLGARIRKSVAASCGVEIGTIAFLRRGALPRTSSGKIKRGQALAEFDRLVENALYVHGSLSLDVAN